VRFTRGERAVQRLSRNPPVGLENHEIQRIWGVRQDELI
jgi:hypothetical protein